MEFNQLSKPVIDSAIDVHHDTWPGLLESTNKKYLAHELKAYNIGYMALTSNSFVLFVVNFAFFVLENYVLMDGN